MACGRKAREPGAGTGALADDAEAAMLKDCGALDGWITI